MKPLLSFLLLFLLPLQAEPNAEEILRATRYVSTLNKTDLSGHLKKGSSKIPVRLFMREKNIQLQYHPDFKTGWNGIHLQLNDHSCELYNVTGKDLTRFPDEKLGQSISGTDLTYEDLSMRFLYWPKPALKGSGLVGIHGCYIIDVYNPDQRGNYGVCRLWIHKKAAALMQVEAFNWKGKKIKTFKVSELMRVGEDYTIEKMKVETIENDRTVSISYLIFDRPKEEKPSQRKLR